MFLRNMRPLTDVRPPSWPGSMGVLPPALLIIKCVLFHSVLFALLCLYFTVLPKIRPGPLGLQSSRLLMSSCR